MLLILVLLLIVCFFSIKLSLLNPKSDLNLIVCGFHNVLRIITEIEITSIT